METPYIKDKQERLYTWYNDGMEIMSNIMAYIRAGELLASDDAFRIANWLVRAERVKKQIAVQSDIITELIDEINAT